MRRAGLLLAGILLAAAAPACGTPDSSFPAEAECAGTVPLPTSRAVAGVTSPQAYVDHVRQTTVELRRLHDQFVSTYPNDTFYRRESFRPDVARYADETVCVALAIRQLNSPIAGLDAWTIRVHAALDALIEHTRFGRDAVRSRNVSEYRQYRADLQTHMIALETVAFTSP